MLFPSKSFILSKSLIGIGAMILAYIDETNSIDELYKILNSKYKYSFREFTLACTILFLLGIIYQEDLLLHKVKKNDH